jgi:hypothetical protein
MGSDSDAATKRAVGGELLAVLPRDGIPWYKKGHMLKLHFCVLSLVMFCKFSFQVFTWVGSILTVLASANGYDGSLMNGLQALDQWREFMDSPTGVWLGFINAIYWAGTGLTYLAMPWLSNKYGRKLGVYFGYGLLVLGIGLCGIDNDVGFIMSRFFVGCASATFASTVPLLINEIAYPTHRGIANALFMCGWYVGGTIAAFIVSRKEGFCDTTGFSTNVETDFRYTKHGRQYRMAHPNNPTDPDTRSRPPRSHLGTGVTSLAHLQRPRK